ncbi:MAG TPA: class I SAM-dependent methyltransferase [Oligoflexia bacterium]|nr:class I SAM-dependent methyltransferase [Oligoflexia bacterium]HMP48842.1 class I SAM-dependent methyltransferase [Oligoflexia bacterium]
MLAALRNSLIDPRIAEIDKDSEDRIRVHNEILSSKKMMREVFAEFYSTCTKIADTQFTCKDGKELEIGAGVSFFRTVRPNLIVTDIVPAPHLDMVLDAQNMHQIEDNSLKAIYALNVFHHLPDPGEFFREIIRVLKPGGGCILIEPFYGTLAKPFYKNLHESEHFNINQKEWEAKEETGVMTNANQALSYIVLVRDRARFMASFPELEIVISKPLQNYLRYLFSGGINFKQLLPDFCIPVLKLMEKMLIPVSRYTALHHIIVIRKKAWKSNYE